MTTKTVAWTTVGSQTITVPADYGTPSRLILIGGGTNGSDGSGPFSGGGGGGGAVWWLDNPSLVAGQTYNAQVGATSGGHGNPSGPGPQDTWFNNASSFAYAQGANGSNGGVAFSVGGGSNNAGGTGTGGGFAFYQGGMGGGAAGPDGAGASGAPGNTGGDGGGGGGGGANGGSAGSTGSGTTGGSGGLNRLGTGGGAGGLVGATGGAGSNGGGGGGGGGSGGGSAGSGGAGSMDILWTDAGNNHYGPGGGGGGGGNENHGGPDNSGGGGPAGGYGGGGGGGAGGGGGTNPGAAGTPGLIVLVYTPNTIPTPTVWTASGAGAMNAAPATKVHSVMTAAGAGAFAGGSHSATVTTWTSAGAGNLIATTPPEDDTVLPTMLQRTIGSYLYVQYNDDDDLQAFVIAYNDLAQAYLDWFNRLNLPNYTAANISGELLDWVGAGLYGQPRPSLPTGVRSTVIGPLNTYTPNSWPLNAIKKVFVSDSGLGSAIGSFIIGVSAIGGGIQYLVNDDIYRRVLSWRFFKGDGRVFSIRWLKRRIMRFLFGVDGVYFNVDQTYPVSVTFGLDGQVNIRLVRYVRTITGGALPNTFMPNTRYCNEVTSTVAVTPPNPLGPLLQAGIESGVLELPFQQTYVVTV